MTQSEGPTFVKSYVVKNVPAAAPVPSVVNFKCAVTHVLDSATEVVGAATVVEGVTMDVGPSVEDVGRVEPPFAVFPEHAARSDAATTAATGAARRQRLTCVTPRQFGPRTRHIPADTRDPAVGGIAL